MSGVPRIRSLNVADTEAREVLGPAGNKAHRSPGSRKPVSKPIKKDEKPTEEVEMVEDKNGHKLSHLLQSANGPSILQRQDLLLHSSLSLSASCSSETSTDSFHSRASTGRINRTRSISSRRKQYPSKSKSILLNDVSNSSPEGVLSKKRCAWVTPNTDPSYANFHDQEWGVPVHDDQLFELLVLCGALAELTWPSILSRRHIFREIFADFDPVAVAKLNEKKILAPGSIACSLLSEFKLRAVLENARQVVKIIDEFGSFDKYIWSFVNHKPIVGRFRYSRQVPIKTSKADMISKDLVQRGFRGVGPTVVYSFMQVAGITNDHLISCYRFQDCVAAAEGKEKDPNEYNNTEAEKANEAIETQICRTIDDLSFSLE